jgi:hypothetical protein
MEVNMRSAIVAALTIGTLALVPTSAFSQYTQQSLYRQNQPGVTQAAYSRCYQLALQRGVTVSKGDRNVLEQFISNCLEGKIPF